MIAVAVVMLAVMATVTTGAAANPPHTKASGIDVDATTIPQLEQLMNSRRMNSVGLPLGVSFIGGRWAEPQLLGLAYDYEQATHVRVPPQFIPTIGDALFPGVPNPAAQTRAQRQRATPGQRDLVVRVR